MNLSINTVTRLFAVISATLALCVVTPVALAGPILADDGVAYIERSPSPLGTTPVADPAGNPIGVINYGSGQILLKDYANQPLTTYAPPGPSWWNAPGVAYTTTTSGIYIDFVDLNVTGFTFNIGANMNANAWIKAYYDDGAGHELSTSWFSGVGPTSTPSFGVYIHDPFESCAQITRIEVDPTFEWGVGNFGIAESASSCASVPAPATDTLLSMGLLAMGMSHILWMNRNRRFGLVSRES
tara:strand:+ start:683 stop:1405 length:723 start_codon:yes stop_codon:yes gene_type:complete